MKTTVCFLLILILLMGILHDLSINLKFHTLLFPYVTELLTQDNCKHSPQVWFAPYHSNGRELTHSVTGPKLSHLGLAGTWNTTQVLAQSSSKTFPLTKIQQYVAVTEYWYIAGNS